MGRGLFPRVLLFWKGRLVQKPERMKDMLTWTATLHIGRCGGVGPVNTEGGQAWASRQGSCQRLCSTWGQLDGRDFLKPEIIRGTSMLQVGGSLLQQARATADGSVFPPPPPAGGVGWAIGEGGGACFRAGCSSLGIPTKPSRLPTELPTDAVSATTAPFLSTP